MTELFSSARRRALAVLHEEVAMSAADELASIFPEGGANLNPEQKQEVVAKVFEKIKEELEPLIAEFRANDWEVEFDFNEEDSTLTAIFSDTADEVFYINYYVGPHNGNKKDGIIVEDLSFAVGDQKFSVSIDSEESSDFRGVGSYKGVVEVTKRICGEYLERFFIKTLAPGLIEQDEEVV
ncbi:MAG: hypothetical protein IT416_02180 [Candidatus Pacebacteria bacterium]|nr:hypothetical protein [Candidatus Paceibacterota bacterium]